MISGPLTSWVGLNQPPRSGMVNTKAAGSEPQAQAAEEMPTLAIGVAVVLVFPSSACTTASPSLSMV